MSNPHHISAYEQGLVRLFTTEMEPETDAAITAQNFHKLLGKDIALDPSKVEVFASKTITDIGLTKYLIDGYGVDDTQLKGKTAALDALKGIIILLPTSAFMGKDQTIEPNPALRFIGAFHEFQTERPKAMKSPDTAKGQLSSSGQETTVAPHSAKHFSWIIALGALVIAATLILFLAT